MTKTTLSSKKTARVMKSWAYFNCSLTSLALSKARAIVRFPDMRPIC